MSSNQWSSLNMTLTFLLLSCCNSSICRSLSGSSSSDWRKRRIKQNTISKTCSGCLSLAACWIALPHQYQQYTSVPLTTWGLRTFNSDLRSLVSSFNLWTAIFKFSCKKMLNKRSCLFSQSTFSSSSDSRKAFLSIAAFILPSKSSKLRRKGKKMCKV